MKSYPQIPQIDKDWRLRSRLREERSQVQPVVTSDAEFSDDLTNQANADILTFVKGDRDYPAGLEVDHSAMAVTGERSLETQVLQFPNDFLRLEWDKPRHAPVR
jgi:hypothetical protein